MTPVFPSPLIPYRRKPPTLPHPFTAESDGGKNGWWVRKGHIVHGHAFPHVVRDLAGDWHGRRHGLDPETGWPYEARRFPGEVQALAYVCGCEPSEIRFEEAR